MRTLILLLVAASSLLTAQTSSLPLLSYSTYLQAAFRPAAMAADAAGNVYLAGGVAPNPLVNESSVVVAKFNRQANDYVYVSQVNGLESGSPSAIAVDGAGNVWITGTTSLPNDPAHPDASRPARKSFLAELDPTGVVVFLKTIGRPAQSYAQAIRLDRDQKMCYRLLQRTECHDDSDHSQ